MEGREGRERGIKRGKEGGSRRRIKTTGSKLYKKDRERKEVLEETRGFIGGKHKGGSPVWTARRHMVTPCWS